MKTFRVIKKIRAPGVMLEELMVNPRTPLGAMSLVFKCHECNLSIYDLGK